MTTENPQHYLLKLTASQAQTLVHALDLYSRIGIGQFEQIAHLARMGMIRQREGVDQAGTAYEVAAEYLNEAKRAIIGFEPNASHGIHSPLVDDEFRVAWDLQKVIRHRLAWDRAGCPAKRDWAGGMMGVDYDSPHPASKEPLATMEAARGVDIMDDLPPGFAIAKAPGRIAYTDDQKWHLLDARTNKVSDIKWVASGESVKSMIEAAIADTATTSS